MTTEALYYQDQAATWYGESRSMIEVDTVASRDAAAVLQEVARRCYEKARLAMGMDT